MCAEFVASKKPYDNLIFFSLRTCPTNNFVIKGCIVKGYTTYAQYSNLVFTNWGKALAPNPNSIYLPLSIPMAKMQDINRTT